MMDRNDRIKAHMLAMGNSLDAARIAYEMLLDELAGSDETITPVDVADPQPLLAHDNPVLCQHPAVMEVLGQTLCDSCGTNTTQ